MIPVAFILGYLLVARWSARRFVSWLRADSFADPLDYTFAFVASLLWPVMLPVGWYVLLPKPTFRVPGSLKRAWFGRDAA